MKTPAPAEPKDGFLSTVDRRKQPREDVPPQGGESGEAAPAALAVTKPHGDRPLAEEKPSSEDNAGSLLGRSVGAYRVTRELGRGGMGVVYEAVHETLRRRVALKTLHPRLTHNEDMVQRFKTEALAGTMVHDPGLVQIFDVGRLEDGTLYFVMEFLVGETLAQRLETASKSTEKGLALGECVRLARQIATAMASAHAHGVFHRDLKPSNVYVVADREAEGGQRTKVLDFGLAKIRKLNSDEETDDPGTPQPSVQTSASVVMGTPTYMAPEQCRGLALASDRADVYALGAMLYEMLAGVPPFLKQSTADLMVAHLTEPPIPLRTRRSDLPRSLSDLVDAMLSKETAGRPTMAEAASSLEALEGPQQRAPEGTQGRGARSGQGAAIGVGGVLLVGVGVLWGRIHDGGPAPARQPLSAPQAEVQANIPANKPDLAPKMAPDRARNLAQGEVQLASGVSDAGTVPAKQDKRDTTKPGRPLKHRAVPEKKVGYARGEERAPPVKPPPPAEDEPDVPALR